MKLRTLIMAGDQIIIHPSTSIRANSQNYLAFGYRPSLVEATHRNRMWIWSQHPCLELEGCGTTSVLATPGFRREHSCWPKKYARIRTDGQG